MNKIEPNTSECSGMESVETKTVAQFHLTKRRKYELFSLWVWRDGNAGCDVYDVDVSKSAGGYVWHLSGGGFTAPVEVDGIYWASHDGLVKEKPCALVNSESRKRNKTRRLNTLPTHLRSSAGNVLGWLENNAIKSETEYCSICRDCVLADSNNPCPHIWWCSEVNTWSTPDERVKGCKCEECAA